jgi:4-methyl-5(b-hydroxyethyl)-thiazole monophosphate biosynthesis
MARVLIPLAHGVEETEAVTVIDILRRADISVDTVGLDSGTVTASRGVVLQPDRVIDDVSAVDYDLIALPGGGDGAKRLMADQRVTALLQTHSEAGRWTGAICAAPKVLASAGLLEGRRVTSFPGWLDDVSGIEYLEEPVVLDGPVVTSRGPGTAMDFALQLVELLTDRDTAAAVEAKLQRPPAQQRYR